MIRHATIAAAFVALHCDGVAQNVSICVRVGAALTSQGTAWFATDRHVVTALHVVGSVEADAWAHELDPERRYELGDGSRLTAVAKSCATDLALLRADAPRPEGDITQLAPDTPRAGEWHAFGFPGFYGGEFGLTGKVVHVVLPPIARSVQLLVDQGTRVDWGGISGASVMAAGGAVGVITNVTDDVATAWAAPVEAVHALLATASVALQDAITPAVPRDLTSLRFAARSALATDSEGVKRWRTSLVHELELSEIHENRVKFFAKQMTSPLAAMTPYFQEQFEHHREELIAVAERLAQLLARVTPRANG